MADGKGFTRSVLTEAQKAAVINDHKQPVSAEIEFNNTEASASGLTDTSTESKDIVKSARIKKEDLDFSKVDPKDFHKLIGRGIIQAIPLEIPNFINVKCKDPNYVFKWINWKGEDGTRVAQFKAAGYVPATVEDIDGTLAFDPTVTSVGICYKDVVLMKVPKRVILQNLEAVYQATQLQSGRSNLSKVMFTKAKEQFEQNNTVPREIAEKLGFFIPEDSNPALKSNLA